MDELKIEYLPISALKPYERNARRHEKKDVDAIAASIEYAGFNDPIGIWGAENLIVEGHGRLYAAQKLGMASVPCIRLDHLDDEQRQAYALAHNRTAELSEWILDIRDEELEGILDVDMSLFGFDVDSVDFDEGELDDDSEQSESESVVVKLTFSDYRAYKKHESDIKNFAEHVNASYTIGK